MRMKVDGNVSARVVDNVSRKAGMIARTAVKTVPNRGITTRKGRRDNKREDPFVPNPPKDGGGGWLFGIPVHC